jgi:S-phase kinase-associated protein 1
MSSSDVVTLVSNDDQTFTVDRSVAEMSVTLKNLIEDAGTEVPIPLPNVKGATLRKTIEFYKLQEEKADFLDGVEQPFLFELILAANYLDCAKFLEFLSRAVANQVKGKTPEEICKHFGFPGGAFTAEEEEQVRKENEWCEER